MNEGYRWKKKLFSEQGRAQLEKLALAPWASRRRQELLELLDRLNPTIEEQLQPSSGKPGSDLQHRTDDPPRCWFAYGTGLRVDHRNSGTVFNGQAERSSTYVGMIPSEDSSAGKQRLGHISKQGQFVVALLAVVEAAQAAARIIHPDWRRRYIPPGAASARCIAKVALGRRLAVRLYWMWRNGCEYSQSLEFGSHAGQLGTGHGVNLERYRLNDWAPRSPARGSLNRVIMVEVLIGEMFGSDSG